jgi:hypothetical protein
MSEVHVVVGFAVVAVFTVLWIWGLGAKLLRRHPGSWFWRWLTVVQLTAIAQVLIGLVLLLALGRSRELLHYVYGFGPLIAIAIAHAVARERQDEPWVVFGLAGFVAFGLSLRALMTGLGVG